MTTNTSFNQLDMLMKSKERFKHGTGKLAITSDNTKVLGRITDTRTEKVRESQKFSTTKMKTHNSAWTPVVNKASNEQVCFDGVMFSSITLYQTTKFLTGLN